MKIKNKFIKNYGFSLIILISVVLGSITGIIMKDNASVFKPLGDIFLNLMFTIVVPLVFFTVTSSIAKMVDLKRLGKIAVTSLIVFIITCSISAIFMFISLKIVSPIDSTNMLIDNTVSNESISVGQKIVEAITVNDFSDILSRSHILPLIIFSIIVGVSISMLKEKAKKLTELLEICSNAMMKAIKIVMFYAPIGLFGYFANLIGTFGTTLVKGYIKSFLIYLVVGVLYYFIFYTLYAFIAGGKKGVKLFYKNILNPTVVALATQSSLATLPTNLESASKMGIPEDISEVSMSVGCSMNMHGSVMSAILKISFLFAIFGRDFTGIGTFLTAILISVLSGVVMSGIPAGGLIGEMLIVSMYSFPAGAFAIISTIGIIIDAPATAINVVGNPASCMLISRFVEGKNWLNGKEKNVS